MNAEYGAKPITCPKPVLRRRIWSSYALEPVVNLDFQWARRHPAHQRSTAFRRPALVFPVLFETTIEKFDSPISVTT